jgi:hypothetical protein
MRRAADIDRAGAQLIIEATGRNSGTHASGHQLEPPEAEP